MQIEFVVGNIVRQPDVDAIVKHWATVMVDARGRLAATSGLRATDSQWRAIIRSTYDRAPVRIGKIERIGADDTDGIIARVVDATGALTRVYVRWGRSYSQSGPAGSEWRRDSHTLQENPCGRFIPCGRDQWGNPCYSFAGAPRATAEHASAAKAGPLYLDSEGRPCDMSVAKWRYVP